MQRPQRKLERKSVLPPILSAVADNAVNQPHVALRDNARLRGSRSRYPGFPGRCIDPEQTHWPAKPSVPDNPIVADCRSIAGSRARLPAVRPWPRRGSQTARRQCDETTAPSAKRISFPLSGAAERHPQNCDFHRWKCASLRPQQEESAAAGFEVRWSQIALPDFRPGEATALPAGWMDAANTHPSILRL